MFIVFALITTQALLGAVDNLWHHEITERLPAKRAAAVELMLHSARELIYAFVFVGTGLVSLAGHLGCADCRCDVD